MAHEPSANDVARSITGLVVRAMELVQADYHGRITGGELKLLVAVYLTRASETACDARFKMGTQTTWEAVRAAVGLGESVLEDMREVDAKIDAMSESELDRWERKGWPEDD